MTRKPAPVFGLRRRHRVTGEPFMVATIDEAIELAPGTELHLRRLHDGNLPTPEFALIVIEPKADPSKVELARARADRLDGSALRRDSRDFADAMPTGDAAATIDDEVEA